MRVLPVLDLLRGVVVRGVAGKRDDYRPLQCPFAPSAEPVAVADGLASRFGANEFYVADLDAILDRRPNLDIWRRLSDAGHLLWIDAGLRTLDDAAATLDAGAATIVAGLETIPGPDFLRRLCERFGPDCVVFSLDLKDGRPLGKVDGWRYDVPREIAAQAIVECGVRRMLVLDLAAVGVSAGPASLPLCRELRAAHPDIELATGGGVRGADDLIELHAAGIDVVLVASALHNGAITPDDLERLR